jgi:hypothetical protein
MSHEIPKEENLDELLTRDEMAELGVEEDDNSYYFKAPAEDEHGNRIFDEEGKPAFRTYHFMKVLGRAGLKKAITEKKRQLGLLAD